MQPRRALRGSGGETAARARAPAGRSPACRPPSARRRRQPAAGDDAVHVRMVRQRRAPGVQDQGHADLRTQMLGIGGDGAQRLGGDIEQQAVDHGLVVIGDGADRRRQGEHHVVVVHRQQFGLAGLEPALARHCPGTSGNAGCGRSCRRSRACAQASQRSTCPPSAALRHCSMADITLS